VPARRKLIVVSNRGPISYSRDPEGALVAGRGGGGLVTALRGLLSEHDVTWIASAISDEDQSLAGETRAETARDGSAFRLRLIAHPREAYDLFYNVVANPTLWFLQHYLWNLGETPTFDAAFFRAWEDGYVAVNRAFADAALAELEAEPEAAVFLHDYHLYLAPRFVRDGAPDAAIAHFVHIPWPQADYWHILPPALRTAIHDGVLASDVVGLHTRRWQQNLLRSACELLGAKSDLETGSVTHRGRRTLLTRRPISVDPAEFVELAQSEAVLAAERTLTDRRPERLILRVDRTDPSKNVVRGFRAYELLLDAHPELQGRVQLLALLDPSRQEIAVYADYLAAIETAAQAVNDRFGREGWEPVRLEVQDDFPGVVAAYKQFDVLLVNAVFDGLNLVAKEAPLVNTRDGVLVLSENAGVHEELGRWAITVNPFDVAGQAHALYEALELPSEERAARLQAIRAHVREHDVSEWIAAQLADLDRWRVTAS
jgi:trehalose 6-phosphate synthase